MILQLLLLLAKIPVFFMVWKFWLQVLMKRPEILPVLRFYPVQKIRALPKDTEFIAL